MVVLFPVCVISVDFLSPLLNLQTSPGHPVFFGCQKGCVQHAAVHPSSTLLVSEAKQPWLVLGWERVCVQNMQNSFNMDISG